MNADKKISRTAKKSQTEIMLGGEKLILSGNINLLTAANLSKYSGYSVGNIYHHFKNLDTVFINIFIKKRLEIFLQLADEINKFPKSNSCEELCKNLVNKVFESTNKLKEQVRSEDIFEEVKNFNQLKVKEKNNIFKKIMKILGF